MKCECVCRHKGYTPECYGVTLDMYPCIKPCGKQDMNNFIEFHTENGQMKDNLCPFCKKEVK